MFLALAKLLSIVTDLPCQFLDLDVEFLDLQMACSALLVELLSKIEYFEGVFTQTRKSAGKQVHHFLEVFEIASERLLDVVELVGRFAL